MRAVRDTAIAGIALTDGQVDHTTGLLMLREGAPLRVYCTDGVRDDLCTVNPLFGVLAHYCGVDWRRVEVAAAVGFRVDGVDGLSVRAVPLKSKPPPYSSHRDSPRADDNVGFEIKDEAMGGTLFYAPGVGQIDRRVRTAVGRADCVLVDGTFWSDDEMIRLEIATKRARDTGHLPQSGTGGMIEELFRYPNTRKVLVHINNTNPILDERSPERAQLTAAGIEVAHDGMELRV